MVYAWCVRRVEDRDKFDHMLSRPPAGMVMDVTSEVVAEELSAFATFTGMIGSVDG